MDAPLMDCPRCGAEVIFTRHVIHDDPVMLNPDPVHGWLIVGDHKRLSMRTFMLTEHQCPTTERHPCT